MGRPRSRENRHLPRYVSIINGTFWYRAPGKEPERMKHADGTSVRSNEESAMYQWLADRTALPVQGGKITTLSDCFDRYEREVLITLEPRTQKDYRRSLKILRRVFGHMRPDEVEPRDVGQFLDVPTGKVQRNRHVAVLSAVYSKCVGRWYVCKVNPCTNVERNPTTKRTRYVTDAEFALVYDAMPPRMQIAMDLALITGQRQGDLLKLRWEQVTGEGVLFAVSKTRKKVGKKLLVTMSPALEAVLLRARRMLPQLPREYVIRTEDGKPYTAEGFRAIWQRRMKTLTKGRWRKAKGKEPVWEAPKLRERFTFHDLRSKSVSDSASLNEAFERAGHTSMAMTRGVYDRGIRKVTPLK